MGNMTIGDCMKTEPSLYSGFLNKKVLNRVFYGALHAEDIWMEKGTEKENWVPSFIKGFCTMQLPYMYLNRHKRISYSGNRLFGYTVSFSEGVKSRGADKSISKNGITIKKGGNVILPLTEDNSCFIAYSEKGYSGVFPMPDAEFSAAKVYNITADGNEFIGDMRITDKKIILSLKAGQAVVVKAAEK